MVACLLSLCATSAAFVAPLRHTHALRSSAPSMLEKKKDWFYDNVKFMNEPFQFIQEHPEDFSEAMLAMAQYHDLSKQDTMPWNALPMLQDETARYENSLMQKQMQADELAKIIMTADLNTMRELAGDAKYAEKKQLFQNLAQLPPDNRGMLAIHEVITKMSAAGQLPALNAFDGDVEVACQKVAEANAALKQLDEKYTSLFLAVRLTAKLSGAAAQMKKGGVQARPRQQGQGQADPFAGGMPSPQPMQGQGAYQGTGGSPYQQGGMDQRRNYAIGEETPAPGREKDFQRQQMPNQRPPPFSTPQVQGRPGQGQQGRPGQQGGGKGRYVQEIREGGEPGQGGFGGNTGGSDARKGRYG